MAKRVKGNNSLTPSQRIELLQIALGAGAASWELISFTDNLERYVLGHQCTDTPMVLKAQDTSELSH